MTTTKLPEVGKRYRLTNHKSSIVKVLPIITVRNEQGDILEYGVEVFNDIYEELLDQPTEESQ